MNSVNKKIDLDLVGMDDGNAMAIMAAFQRQTRKEGWEQDEIHYCAKRMPVWRL